MKFKKIEEKIERKDLIYDKYINILVVVFLMEKLHYVKLLKNKAIY